MRKEEEEVREKNEYRDEGIKEMKERTRERVRKH